MTTKALVQTSFDYRSLAVDDRGFVKERAVRIHDMARKTAEAIRLIGQWLSEVKERLPHGAWLPWLETEFGWSLQTAHNFMNVYRFCKSQTVRDLPIDVKALYKIAAPSTPEPVREEVVRRAKSGEHITHAKAVEAIASYEKKNEVPTPAAARQIALATGIPTLASNNAYVLPMSQEEENALGDEQHKSRSIYRAIEEIVFANLTPTQMVVLGHKFACRNLAEWSEQAGQWLLSVAEEAKSDG
jgi:hypothetical protein